MDKLNNNLLFSITNNQTKQFLNNLLEETIFLAKDSLQKFANSSNFTKEIQTSFVNYTGVGDLKTRWQTQTLIFPDIEIVFARDINGANGAYARQTNKIYLAQEFLLAHQSDIEAIAAVFLEEYGHYLDNVINPVDTPGDEGAIFSALVRGEELSQSQLQQLQNEDDSVVVTINGKSLEIEQDSEAELKIVSSNPQINNQGEGAATFDLSPSGSIGISGGIYGDFRDLRDILDLTREEAFNRLEAAVIPDPTQKPPLEPTQFPTEREGRYTVSDSIKFEVEEAEETETPPLAYSVDISGSVSLQYFDFPGFVAQELANEDTQQYRRIETHVPNEYNLSIDIITEESTTSLVDIDKSSSEFRPAGQTNVVEPPPGIKFPRSSSGQYQNFDDAFNSSFVLPADESFTINLSSSGYAITGTESAFNSKDILSNLNLEINVEPLTCPDTGFLYLELEDGEFEDSDNDGDCDGEGTVYIGHENGIERILRIVGTTAEHDEDSLTLTGGTVYSEIGGITAPLFTIQDSVQIFFDNLTTQGLKTDDAASSLELAGLKTSIDSFSIEPEGFKLNSDFTLPSNLLDIQVSAKGDNALHIDRQGIGFGSASGTIPLEYRNLGLQLFANLGIVPGTLNLSYEEQDNKLLLNGKIGVSTSLITALKSENPSGTSFTLNLEQKDSKFIQVQNGIADIDGTIEAQNLDLLFGFELPNFKVNLKSANGILTDIGGETSINLPFFAGKTFLPEVIDIELGAKLQPEITVDDVVLTGKGLNIPIPGTLFFLNEITGGVKNLNPTSTETLDYKGGIGASFLPNTRFPLEENSPLARIFNLREIKGSLLQTNFDLTTGFRQTKTDPSGELVSIATKVKASFLTDKLIKKEGDVQWDWQQKFIKGSLETNLLDGFLVSQANLNVNYQTNNFSIVARATSGRITFPNNALFLGAAGETFSQGVNLGLKYSGDGNSSNDVAAAWTAVNIPFIGEKALGFKFNFNGDSDVIFSGKEIPIFNSWQIEPETSWIIISASWENTVDRDVRVRVIDESGNSIEEADFAANNIAIVEDLSNSNTRTVVIDSPNAGVWDLEILNDSGLGEVEFTAFEDTSAPTIDILSVNPDSDNSGSFVINYNATDADSEAAITLFYDTDNEDFDGAIIVDDLIEQDGEGNFVWTPGNIAPGEYYVYATIIDENNAPIFQYAPEPIEITDSADLAIFRDISDEPVSAGAELTYTLTVINNGEDLARNVSITEVLPKGARFVSATVDTPLENNTVNLNLGDLANGESTSVDIAIAATNIIGSATINSVLSSDTFDPVLGNDDDVAVIDIINSQDLPEIEINDVSVLESDEATEIVFNVSISESIAETITVDYATANITAIAGEDYIATEGTLEFAPGETEKVITVNIAEDLETEVDKSFSVNLSSIDDSIVFSDESGIGTIVDNEPQDNPPTVATSIEDVTVNENSEDKIINLSNLFEDVDGDEIAITVQSNSNGDLVTATIEENNLILNFAENKSGAAEITLRGTANGETVDETFTITIEENTTQPESFIELFRFRNTTFDTGTYVFVGEAERNFIIEDSNLNNTFALDGLASDGTINPAFTASTNGGDGLIPFYRLESLAVPGTFLFVSTAEYNFIFDDPVQSEQWKKQGFDESGETDIAEFYLIDSIADRGIQFDRFQNIQNGTFLYAGEAETRAIANNPDLANLFINQGNAFESFI